MRTRNLEINYTLTETIVEDILANGFASVCGFDEVDFDKSEYLTAKQSLLDEGLTSPVIEQVEARMLFMGFKLRLHMAEERHDEEWYDLTLADIMDGLRKYAKDPINGSVEDFIIGDPDCRLDFYDYDAVLQYATYGEVLIG